MLALDKESLVDLVPTLRGRVAAPEAEVGYLPPRIIRSALRADAAPAGRGVSPSPAPKFLTAVFAHVELRASSRGTAARNERREQTLACDGWRGLNCCRDRCEGLNLAGPGAVLVRCSA